MSRNRLFASSIHDAVASYNRRSLAPKSNYHSPNNRWHGWFAVDSGTSKKHGSNKIQGISIDGLWLVRLSLLAAAWWMEGGCIILWKKSRDTAVFVLLFAESGGGSWCIVNPFGYVALMDDVGQERFFVFG